MFLTVVRCGTERSCAEEFAIDLHRPYRSGNSRPYGLGYRGPVERVAVRVVGAFGVDGLDERAVGSRKARTLLKLLACERGDAVSVDRIAEAIWGEHLPSKPADQISVLVSRLRSVLGGRIERSDGGYALRYDWLDLDELLELSAEAVARLSVRQFGAARAASVAALRLVGGRILADEDAAWSDGVRVGIERAVGDARRCGALAALELGAMGDAANLGLAALDREPYDEVAVRVVMSAYARMGQVGAALEVYSSFRDRLIEDFGVGPSALTEQLHDDIVLGRIDSASDSVDAIGTEPTKGLVGRDVELQALDGWLAQSFGASQFVVISGEPGIGKSALVESWSRRLARSGVEVIAGCCDQRGLSLALQPVIDAVDEWLVRVVGLERADELKRGDAALARLFGTSGAFRPAALGDAATSLEEAGIGRRRLFAALGSLIQSVRADAPLVVVMDDVDQADSATVAWLGSFVGSAPMVLVVVTCRLPDPTLPATNAIALEPLGPQAAEALIGADAGRIYARSGGNPLFLLELARVPEGDLPNSVVEAVARRSSALGPAASTVRIAALLGPLIDLDLLGACCRRPIAEVLDHIETAVVQGLVIDEADGLRFRHDVVREALVAATTGSVRVFVHRQASMQLTARSDRNPLDAAHHAERGGSDRIASDSFIEAAQIAMERFEADVAEALLDRAIALVDTPPARAERARVHLSQRRFDEADVDITAALDCERSSSSLELAGWIAYYRRDFARALTFVAEAQVSALPEIRASAATLDGRIRHSQGDLLGARARLQAVVDAEHGPVGEQPSGVARVWLASVMTHQGSFDEALDMLDAVGDPSSIRSHPFATAHAWFTRCLAAGICGDLVTAFQSAEALAHHADNSGTAGLRFRPIACNMRSWLERSVGNHDRAMWWTSQALLSAEASFDEPAAHARLDHVELLLITDQIDAAAVTLEELTRSLSPSSTMAWHQRQRAMLLSGRLALKQGDAPRAAHIARALGDDALAHSSQRPGVLASQLRIVADATAGQPTNADEVAALVRAIDRLAALESWRLIAEMAAATRLSSLFSEAEERARRLAVLTGDIPHLDAAAVGAWLGSTILAIRQQS